MLLLAACAPKAQVAPSVGDAVVALEALPWDSLCGPGCRVVVVDSTVRRTRSLRVYRPFDARAAFSLSWRDIGGLRTPTRSVALGRPLSRLADRDTMEVGLYLVSTPSPLGEQRLYGVMVLPPGGSVTTWYVALHKVNETWQVLKRDIYSEP